MTESRGPNIVLVGGTGTIGRHLLRTLAERGVAVRALSRAPERGEERPGVDWVRANLSRPDDLVAAFRGARRLFLLTANSSRLVELESNALAAAREAGLYHVVKLSALGASRRSRSLIGLWHWVVEQELRSSQLAWTLLRPHHFMQNLLDQRQAIATEGVVRYPTGDGRIPFVDTRDVAEVAAVVLTTPGHGGRTYTLTGPEAISYRGATRILAEETGRHLRFEEPSTEDYERSRRADGDPEWLISGQLAIAEYQRAEGPTARTTSTIEELTGRPARRFRDFARDHAEAFRAPTD